VTVRFQSTGVVPGDGRPFQMLGGSMTIGRGDENDLVLPDPNKMVSRRHCVIQETDGQVTVVDVSSNGTFLNYGKVPLGQVPSPVNNGDILTVGPYELVLDIEDEAPAAAPDALPPFAPEADAPAQPLPVADPLDPMAEDFLSDDFLRRGSAPTGPSGVSRPGPGEAGGDILPPFDPGDLLGTGGGPAAPTRSVPDHSPSLNDSFSAPVAAPRIPDDYDFSDLMPGQTAEPAPAQPSGDASNPFITVPPRDGEEVPPEPPVTMAPTGASAPAAGEAVALRAFLDAAGLADVKVPADQTTATMARLGGVFRTMVAGLREILMTRASIKSEFRIEQTMIAAGANNPLKFSVSEEQAIQTMVAPSVRGYLDPDEAARQALDDIKAHEVATIAGMQAAMRGVLAQLSPEVLERQITGAGGITDVFKGKKARYWEAYEKLYAQIADQAESDFHETFAKAFAAAYKEQLARLKQEKQGKDA
jgi:type VI secretion system FHA domain protein